ncbi:MAG: hypothetical protein ACI9GB_003558 [Halioglobus sp.]|jgi:hypothetical protein
MVGFGCLCPLVAAISTGQRERLNYLGAGLGTKGNHHPVVLSLSVAFALCPRTISKPSVKPPCDFERV